MILLRTALTLLTALQLAACASTAIRSAWFDTSYQGGPLKKIAVVGVGGQAVDRRVFEDAFAQQLRAAGVDAVPGYTILSDAARQSETAFNAAIQGSGADGVLIVELLSVDTRTRITTAMMPSSAFRQGWGRAPGFAPTWIETQQVRQYDVARVEASLYEARSRQLIWAASTDTFNPTSVARETPGFADLIIRELRTRGLIAGAT